MKNLKLREFRKLAQRSYNVKEIKPHQIHSCAIYYPMNEFSFERADKPEIAKWDDQRGFFFF